jgi:hypothetical protein
MIDIEAEVTKLSLEPEDIILVKVLNKPKPRQLQELKKQMDDLRNNYNISNRFIITQEGLDLETLKSSQYAFEGKREYDFEGRCTKCKTRLLLRLDRTSSQHRIYLSVIPCKLHPEDWPQREDLIHE